MEINIRSIGRDLKGKDYKTVGFVINGVTIEPETLDHEEQQNLSSTLLDASYELMEDGPLKEIIRAVTELM